VSADFFCYCEGFWDMADLAERVRYRGQSGHRRCDYPMPACSVMKLTFAPAELGALLLA
jgi:hypothetical protein